MTTGTHWKNPAIYMSRDTTREVWRMFYGTEPDLYGDLRFGQSQIPVLFDDRMELGVARLEEDPMLNDDPQDGINPDPFRRLLPNPVHIPGDTAGQDES